MSAKLLRKLKRMHDTTPEVERIYSEMLRSRTPLERFQMVSEMFDTARTLMAAGILRENPNLSELEVKREVFRRMYREDFTPEQMEKILQHILQPEPGK